LRRLRQNVAAFRDFVSAEAARLARVPGFFGMDADTLAAKVVGRWPDGSALARAPDTPSADETSDMLRINAFEYFTEWAPAQVCGDPAVAREPLGAVAPAELRTVPGAPADTAGLRCPTFAHIRKVNPRGMNTEQGPPLVTRQSQMLRRGITWGTQHSRASADDDGDRGLLFMSYQTSIDTQFERLTAAWMNLEQPPEGQSGYDLLVGQDNDSPQRRAVLRSGDPAHPDAVAALSTGTHTPWIVPTGGEYLFAPSRSALARFARG
jgi:deferrochelatase/peroxidase EfeB